MCCCECTAGKLQEMDDLIFSDADAKLNLTAMLVPLFNKVAACYQYGYQNILNVNMLLLLSLYTICFLCYKEYNQCELTSYIKAL